MTHPRFQDELLDAVKQGDEARAKALVSRLAAQPRQARAVLEGMLADPRALMRQAAAFGLGVLGGAASARLLEQRLAIEEARGDYDGDSVAEEITRALGHIEEASARTSLVRKLEGMAAGKTEPVDVDVLVGALWKRRHSDLLPPVRRSLERLSPPASSILRGLLTLLEKTPEELGSWARESTVPLEQKTEVITLLDDELPDALRAAPTGPEAGGIRRSRLLPSRCCRPRARRTARGRSPPRGTPPSRADPGQGLRRRRTGPA